MLRALPALPSFLLEEKKAKETSVIGLCKFYIAFSRGRRGTALAVDEAWSLYGMSPHSATFLINPEGKNAFPVSTQKSPDKSRLFSFILLYILRVPFLFSTPNICVLLLRLRAYAFQTYSFQAPL